MARMWDRWSRLTGGGADHASYGLATLHQLQHGVQVPLTVLLNVLHLHHHTEGTQLEKGNF